MRAGVLLALSLLASPVAAAADDDLRARAGEALEAARELTLKEPMEGRLDAVWHTDLLLQIRPDPQLQYWADVRRRMLSGNKSYRLVEPSAPPHVLPDDPGTGIRRFWTYLSAPFGTPESTAVRYVSDYLAHEEDDYILTHQLAVLEWSKQVGLALPGEVLAKKPALLARITAEHEKDEAFSDLFVERMFFLVVYGEPSDAELERTVRVIVDAQTAPGVWAPHPVSYSYDGETWETTVEPEHARKMAMVVLAGYLRDDGPGPEPGPDPEPGPGLAPDPDPEPDSVPEPATGVWAVAGVAVAAIFLLLAFRRRRS